jgi:hypothetical protein
MADKNNPIKDLKDLADEKAAKEPTVGPKPVRDVPGSVPVRAAPVLPSDVIASGHRPDPDGNPEERARRAAENQL